MKIGRYEVERELGRGGMAVVYLARDARYDRHVAIKVLRRELTPTILADRFLQEIQFAAQLNHPHIVQLFDSGTHDGTPYYVMPHIEGGSLYDRLEREGQLSVDAAIRVIAEVGDALAYAHSRNILHRDIKPGNILFQNGHALVADFGIARALARAGTGPSTSDNIAIGTAEYMSPEQAGGTGRMDQRSDLYALGCVLYEMLAGDPPFTGRRPEDVLRKQVVAPPPPLETARPGLPATVTSSVERALAKVPTDRFDDVTDFVGALSRPLAPAPARKPLRAALAAALAVLGILALAILVRWPPPMVLDPNLYAVLPLIHEEGAAPTLLNGDQCSREIRHALRRWTDVKLVSELRLHSVMMQRGGTPADLDAALATARATGAGRLVWGLVRQTLDSVQIVATLYDVPSGTPLSEFATVVDDEFGEAELPVVRNQVRSLGSALVTGDSSVVPASHDFGTTSLKAFLAFHAGLDALTRWNPSLAAIHLDSATRADPRFADALFWLARVTLWRQQRRTDPAGWTDAATRAIELSAALDTAQVTELRAMVALGEGRHPEACALYDRLLDQDTTSFAAWRGRAECLGRDNAVIPDPSGASPTGWMFRSSRQAAIAANVRALRLVPSFMLSFRGEGYASLDHLVPTPSEIRFGRWHGPDSVLTFGAWPGLEGDTLSYIPYPFDDIRLLRKHAIPPSVWDAEMYYLRLLDSIASAWVRMVPASFQAHDAQSRVREERFDVRGALQPIRIARHLASSGADSARVVSTEVRLLIKLHAWDSAKALVDSALSTWRRPTPEQAYWLAGLAAVTGRAQRTVDLLVIALPETIRRSPYRRYSDEPLARPAFEQSERFRGYAALGVVDSLAMLGNRVDSLVALFTGATPSRPGAPIERLMDDNYTWAFPVLGATRAHRNPGPVADRVLTMQAQVDRADHANAAAELERFRDAMAPWPDGRQPVDDVYQEAFLWQAMGDPTRAAAHLDLALNGLSTLTSQLLREVPQAGALVQAMAFRARLALRHADTTKATQWAEPVVTLWHDADLALQGTVSEMQRLLAARP